jgi:hypothetical protein
MNKNNNIYILIIFIIVGIIGFLLSYFLNEIDFFIKHENITFVLICLICVCIYAIILFFLIRKNK